MLDKNCSRSISIMPCGVNFPMGRDIKGSPISVGTGEKKLVEERVSPGNVPGRAFGSPVVG